MANMYNWNCSRTKSLFSQNCHWLKLSMRKKKILYQHIFYIFTYFKIQFHRVLKNSPPNRIQTRPMFLSIINLRKKNKKWFHSNFLLRHRLHVQKMETSHVTRITFSFLIFGCLVWFTNSQFEKIDICN